MIKSICFFGIYDQEYARNRVLLSGFLQNNVEIIHCNVDPREVTGLKKYWLLYRKARKISHDSKFDAIFVAFPGQTAMLLARMLFPSQKIILDAFVSLYDSNVYDRKRYPKYSLKSMRDFLLDWSSCLLAGTILLDTEEHIDYFSRTFFIRKSKCIRVFVGSDTRIFFPRSYKKSGDKYKIHFHGSYIPLQGIEHIVSAAKLLKKYNVEFRIIGAGQESAKIRALNVPGNIIFENKIPYSVLPERMAKADICLGIFGTTDKAKRVIPNKVFEALAMAKPVITADTPAVRELLVDRQNVLLCKQGDSQDLAETIKMAMENPALLETVGRSGYECFQKNATPEIIVKNLLTEINK